jgi:hypothetical protein
MSAVSELVKGGKNSDGRDCEAYSMSSAERHDIEECERLVALKELEAWDLSWC